MERLTAWTAPACAVLATIGIGFIGSAVTASLSHTTIDNLTLCGPIIGFAGACAGMALSGRTADTYSRSRHAVFVTLIALWAGLALDIYGALDWLGSAFAGLGVILGLYYIGKRAPKGNPLDPSVPLSGLARTRPAAGP